MQGNQTDRRSGAVLVLVSLSMVAAGVLGAALLTGMAGSRSQRVHFDSGTRAVYAAESGRAYVQARTAEDPAYVPSGTYILASGDQFTASGVVVSNMMDVTITGMSHPGTHREGVHGLSFQMTLPSDDGGGGDATLFDFYGSELVTAAAGAVRVSGAGVAIMRDGASYTGNTSVEVANIYIGDDLYLGGASSMGNPDESSVIYVDGNVTLDGSARIYGDLFLTGSFSGDRSRVFGTIHFGFNEDDLPDFVKFARDGGQQPALRTPDQWYYDRGYSANPSWGDGMRVFATGDYVTADDRPSAANVVIVSKPDPVTGRGDITLNMSGAANIMLSGVIFAPAGRVTFNGKGFTGTIVARDGLYTTQGNTSITFQDISTFIDDPADYPLVIE